MDKQEKVRRIYRLKRKSPGAAVGLSLLIIGAGSMYSGKVASGLVQILISIFLWFFMLGWIMWIVSPIIAYHDAKNYNEMLELELDIEL